MPSFKRYDVLFGLIAALSACVFWACTDDWWTYVEDTERGSWPKFEFTWPEQLVISAVVGVLLAIPTTAAVFAVRVAWSRWFRRSNRLIEATRCSK